MSYTYSMGVWTDGHPLPASDGEEDFLAFLVRNGYSPAKLHIGDEDDIGPSIDIHASNDSEGFMALVSPDGRKLYEVFIPNFPSLMMFLKDFGATFSLNVVEWRLTQILEKLDVLSQGG